MKRYVAFLRGMNVGGRRIKNAELRSHVTALGFQGVEVFLASGNVVFHADSGASPRIAAHLLQGLRRALGYEVPTFVRSTEETRAIAARRPFGDERGAAGGKLQVALLASAPSAAAGRAVVRLGTADDRLAIQGRELYWLPVGKLTESALDLTPIEARLGPMTIRTHRTLERLVAKYLDT